jgi:hypothetical protein
MNVSSAFSLSMVEALTTGHFRVGPSNPVGANGGSFPALTDRCRPSAPVRRGITLVEMLVALAVTLLMMGAVVTVFGFIGERVTDSRAMIETADRLRSAGHRLREDLTSITVDAIPWQRPEEGAGYLEILEGPARDARDASGTYALPDSPLAMIGDPDDMLMFTVRSHGEPYRGKFTPPTGSNLSPIIESNTAEVVWFLQPTVGVVTNPQTYSLCRRQMVIVPEGVLGSNAPLDATYYELYDVSARVDRHRSGSIRRVANTLGDLTKRENRFLHNKIYANALASGTAGLGYPWPVRYQPNAPPLPPFSADRHGEDVVLTNVLSFDVQVFDPNVEMRSTGSAIIEPTDPGYKNAPANNTNPARGAYIDLGDPLPGAIFGAMAPGAALKSLLAPNAQQFRYSTYDTWSFHYEHDGIQQTPAGPDKGTNGLDDNATTNPPFPGVDDMSERETSPPYPYPLRGLRVKIRVYEPTSKQVRETTIVQSFVPE